MNSLNWERLRIFKAVLESGSLAGAARRLGLSQPTVGRHVRALELEMDEALVDITPDGVLPTVAALQMAPALDDMTRAADSIASLQEASRDTPTVRISCGPWLSAWLSRNIEDLLGRPVDTHIELVSTIAFADLPRREAHVAIRNQRPRQQQLVVRRLPDYACAAYGAASLVGEDPCAFDERRFARFEWAALAEELEHFPTARWLSSRIGKEPVVRFSASTNLLDAVKGGAVLAVLPCFAGDREDDLVRISKPFIPDYGGHWIVLADDVRRRPHVRRVSDRIVAFLKANEGLMLPSKTESDL